MGHDGGSLYITNTSNIKINDCIFEYNFAFESGGSIYNEDCYYFEIDNSLFHKNKSIRQGGSIHAKVNILTHYYIYFFKKILLMTN